MPAAPPAPPTLQPGQLVFNNPKSTVSLDSVEQMEGTERLGVYRSLTRKVKIRIKTTAVRPSDYTILDFAMSEPGVPQPFDSLAGAKPPYDALVLVERHPKIMDDPWWVEALLKYEHILDGPNQEFLPAGNPFGMPGGNPVQTLYGEGETSMVEKTTNFYFPFGDQTNDRQQIVVSHTYSDKDWQAVGHPDGTWNNVSLPRTIIQGGEIKLPFAQTNFRVWGYTKVTDPWTIENKFAGKINALTWLSKPPFTWLCSRVTWKILDPKYIPQRPVATYAFQFQFQYNSDTWNPTVVFYDERTGRPPATVKKADTPTNFKWTDNPDKSGQGQVFDSNFNNVTGSGKQPAGWWNVAALDPVDFQALFRANFK
jgi:hypothetical protein